MPYETADLVKVGAAVTVSVAAAYFLWTLLSAGDGKKKADEGAKAGKSQAGKGPSKEVDVAKLSRGLWIYYGSQTGTAEGFALELEEEAPAYDIKPNVVDLEKFKPEEFMHHKVVVLVVSTYGEGEPTDNAEKFFQWLHDESLGVDSLRDVQFSVMGCGSRAYVNFNRCGVVAEECLERLGARSIYRRGEGDDSKNIQEDFEHWKEQGLWPALQKAFGNVSPPTKSQPGVGRTVTGALVTAEHVQASLMLDAKIVDSASVLPYDSMVKDGAQDILGKWYFNAFVVPVTYVEELRQVSNVAEGKTTKHIDFDVSQVPGLKWGTADNLEILPRNPEDAVDWFAKKLGVQSKLNSQVGFVRTAEAEELEEEVAKPFPSPCSVRDALGLFCNLCQAPTRTAAKKLGSLMTSARDRSAFQELLQDKETYLWLSGDKVRLNLMEFFELFLPSIEIDVGAFLQLCPRQKSRPYTIASSALEDKNKLSVCVGMIYDELPSLESVLGELAKRGHPVPHAAEVLKRLGDYTAQPRRRFRGLCSYYLTGRISKGDKVWVCARASSFRLPQEKTTPIIMLGAGTGIAPFRAFVREFRSEQGARKKTFLFFGCTKSTEDFVYAKELKDAQGMKPAPALTELVTAFSREQEQKVYVQHRLRERSAEIKQLVAAGACIYVCGAFSMGCAVQEVLAGALGGPHVVKQMQADGRLIEELW